MSHVFPSHSTLVPQKTVRMLSKPWMSRQGFSTRRILGLAPTLLRFVASARTRMCVLSLFFVGPSIPNCWDMKSLGYGDFFRLWSYLSTLFSMIHMKNIISLFYGNSWIAIHQQHSCGISLTDIGYPWRSIGFVGWVWYLYLPLVYSPLFPWSKKNACLCFFPRKLAAIYIAV